MSITYKQIIIVHLDGLVVGQIIKAEDGYHYKPEGCKSESKPFKTISAVKRSIEGKS